MRLPSMLQLCTALFLLGLSALATMPAGAQSITCAASMTNVVFGTVNPLASMTTANATLNYTCTNSANATWSAKVCFSIGDGTQGAGQTNPRQMQDGVGDILTFQLYQNASFATVWGSTFFGVFASPLQVDMTIAKRGTNSGSATMYGRVTTGQTAAVPGAYQDDFGGGHTAITVNDARGSTAPVTCDATIIGGFGFNVNATVSKQCAVSASTLDFGSVGLLTGTTLGTSTIGVQCSSGSAYNIGLDAGANGGGNINARKMARGTNAIGYQLYRNAARTTVWGNTVGTNTVAATGNGSVQNVAVYGSVPAQTTPAAGVYTDTIVVTVTY